MSHRTRHALCPCVGSTGIASRVTSPSDLHRVDKSKKPHASSENTAVLLLNFRVIRRRVRAEKSGPRFGGEIGQGRRNKPRTVESGLTEISNWMEGLIETAMKIREKCQVRIMLILEALNFSGVSCRTLNSSPPLP